MLVSLDVHSLIFIIAATHGFILSFFLFYREGVKKHINLVLVILIFAFSTNMLVRELVRNFYSNVPHLIASTDWVLFLYGPLIYFFTKLSTKEKTKLRKKDLIHLIPFGVCILFFMPFYIQSGEEKLAFYMSTFTEGIPKKLFFIWISGCLHIVLYMLLSAKSINEYQYKIKQRFSNIEKINYRWLQYILLANFIIWLFDAFTLTNYLIGIQVDLLSRIDNYLGYFVAGFVYFLGYRALTVQDKLSLKLQLGEAQERELSLLKVGQSSAKKYQRSGLTKLKADEYKKELLNYMEDEAPYLDPDITLSDLSEALSIPNNHLSQVINQKFDKNFFDFINSYRVKEAKEWLSNPKRNNETMLAIAFESGFKSKSTFNAAFKKLTGITPSQFKKGYYGDKSDKSVS